eukprot:8811403-Pyramimonas_sp.AAC.1
MFVLRATLCSLPAWCMLWSRHVTLLMLFIPGLCCSRNPSGLSLYATNSTCSRPLAKEASTGVEDRGRPAGPGAVGGPPSASSPARDV